APGGTPGSPIGILTVNANVTFGANTNFVVAINGTTAGGNPGYDQLSVTGGNTVTLGATANLLGTTGFAPTTGSIFTIITAATINVSGTFANAPTNGSSVIIGSQAYTVTYNNAAVGTTHNVVLTDSGPSIVYVDDNWAGTLVGTDPANDPVTG